MTFKKALERLYLGIYSPNEMANYYDLVLKALERLEELEKEYDNLKKDYDNKDLECIDLYKENQELKDYIKALDKACEILDWDCPVSQDLVDDLDCENCNDNYKECWKKYFLKEVLENEK